MTYTRRAAAAAAAVVLAAGGAGTYLAASSGSASAVTGQCLNDSQPEYGAIGCGTLYLPNVGYPHSTTALTLSVVSETPWSSVIVKPMNGGAAEDWTLFRVCTGLTMDRSAAQPCGAGKLNGSRFVIESTPFGMQPAGGVNSQASLCLDDDGGRAVLGNCQAGSAYYVTGFPQPPATAGVPPVVQNPPAAETWDVTSDGKLVNVFSGRALADPANAQVTRLRTSRGGGAGVQWKMIGCSAPFNALPKGLLYGCLY